MLLGALAAGWWWFTRPKEMRLVSVISLSDIITISGYTNFQPYNDRLLIPDLEDANGNPLALRKQIIALCDWNGKLIWKIGLPTPEYLRGTNLSDYHYEPRLPSLSPDGCRLAAAIVDGSSQQIIHWKNGHRVGAVRLPYRDWESIATLRLHNSGRIYAWVHLRPTGYVYIIEGSRIIATGEISTSKSAEPGAYTGAFSPDGKAFVLGDKDGFTYYRLPTSGSKLSLSPVYTARERTDLSSSGSRPVLVMDSDLLLVRNGAIYNDHGRISKADEWQFGIRASADSKAVIQYKRESEDSFRVRIMEPCIRRHWIPGGDQLEYSYDLSPDGRYVLVGKEAHRQLITLISKVMNNKHIPSSLKQPLNHMSRQANLVVYEKPGHARARIRISGERWANGLFIQYANNRFLLREAYISRDGHTIKLLCNDIDNRSDMMIFTYTW